MNILICLIEILILVTLSFVIAKKMYGNFHDQSIKMGTASGLITGIIHIIFSCVVNVLSNGEGFITYWETREVVNGVSLNTIKAIGMCLASLIPIILCRCKNIKSYLKYLISACLACGMVYLFELVVIFIVFYVIHIGSVVDITLPLNTFDSLFLALIYFPIGSFVGSLISIVVNLILNMWLKKREN